MIRRRRDRLSAFVATLGYSRAMFVRFTAHEDFPVWRECLGTAFEYFGGVPQQVPFDNAKPVISWCRSNACIASIRYSTQVA